jgi:uncharacterized YigZ family protein
MVSNPDEYKTLAGSSEGIYKEKGSRFIAHAYPVEGVQQVKVLLEDTRKKYHDARHHCYAYRLGETGEESRQSDDGEPSGTAGKPILGQIQSFGVTYVLVVVTRYFGGVKLGTGGLMHAYRSAAQDALAQGTIISRTALRQIVIDFGYESEKDVKRLAREMRIEAGQYDYASSCRWVLMVGRSRHKAIAERFMSLQGVKVILGDANNPSEMIGK